MCNTVVKTPEFKEAKEPLFTGVLRPGEASSFIICRKCGSSMNRNRLLERFPRHLGSCPICGEKE